MPITRTNFNACCPTIESAAARTMHECLENEPDLTFSELRDIVEDFYETEFSPSRWTRVKNYFYELDMA